MSTPLGSLQPAPAETPAFSAAGPADAAANAARSPSVRLERVSKRYGTKEAVRELSLTLYEGEVFAYLGPNGAGKTTTLKITTGLLRPDAGTVEVYRTSMSRDARSAKQQIAYVPDTPFIYDKLTGREFIRFTREMYNVPKQLAEQRLVDLTHRLDMDGFLDRLCETYSHGMRQKVALAAAMIHAPRLLIVDEPMVGLDPRTIRVIKRMFREIAAAGGTVFMSTHTLEIAEEVADRIGIIHAGRLVALGTFNELRTQFATNARLEDIFLQLTEQSQMP
jgi:ABC-2 type transport system ATP-binding protein